MKSNKKSIIILLVVLLVLVAVGFAAFNDVLTITGTANASGKFDVNFTEASVSGSSTGIDTENSSAVIVAGNDSDEVTIVASGLEDSSSRAVFNVTIRNDSTVTAKLNALSVAYNGSDTEDDLFVVTTSLTPNETLAIGESKAYTVTVALKDEAEISDLNSTASFTISLDYEQNI